MRKFSEMVYLAEQLMVHAGKTPSEAISMAEEFGLLIRERKEEFENEELEHERERGFDREQAELKDEFKLELIREGHLRPNATQEETDNAFKWLYSLEENKYRRIPIIPPRVGSDA